MKITITRLLVGVAIFFATSILSLLLRFLLVVLLGPLSIWLTYIQHNFLYWGLQIVALVVVGVLIWKKKDSVIYMVALVLGFVSSFFLFGPMN